MTTTPSAVPDAAIAVPKKEFANIYDYYPLYSLIYSRSRRYKKSEAGGAMFAMRTLASWNSRMGITDFSKQQFNILEILAGEGNHQEFVANPEPYKISSYYNLDIRPHAPTGPEDTRKFVVSNALDYKADPEMGINFIVGFFFTASTITDATGTHSRAVLVDLFKNMRANLPPGGGFLIDFTPNGYSVSLNSLESANTHYQIDVDSDSQIRADFGILPDETCIVSYFRGSEYSRLVSTSYDIFPKPFEVWASGKKRGEIVINEPLTQRYVSETELTDIALDAGFYELKWFKFDHPKGRYKELPNRFCVNEDVAASTANSSRLMANTLLCINK